MVLGNAPGFRCDFLDGPKTDRRFVLWTAPVWDGAMPAPTMQLREALPSIQLKL